MLFNHQLQPRSGAQRRRIGWKRLLGVFMHHEETKEIEMSKVKVRIAVAIDPSGDWNSAGWASGSDDDKMGIACETVANGEARYWLEAELDVPNAAVVEATVTPNTKISG